MNGHRLRCLPLAGPLLALLAVLLATPAGPARAQIVVEDLERNLAEDLTATLDAGLDRFASGDQAESMRLFTAVIDELSRDPVATAGDPTLVALLARALALRSEVRFNLGDEDGARQDLGTLLTVDPGIHLDEERVSPKLTGLLEELRRVSVGTLVLDVEPADAEVLVDGRPVTTGPGGIPVLAGNRQVLARRPGYRDVARTEQVAAGRSRRVAVELERVGPALRVAVRPPTATVRIDGRKAVAGEVSGSEEILVGLEPGIHRLTVTAGGYRTRDLRLELTRLVDYLLPPLALDPARGRITIAGLPRGARLTVDGEPVDAVDKAILELVPGDHRLEVRAGARGSWTRTVRLADRQDLGLAVSLRPALVLLGFRGADEVAGAELAARLTRILERSERWTFSSAVDADGRARVAPEVGDDDWARLGDEPWRIAAEPPRQGWSAVRDGLDATYGASAYVLLTLRGAPYADAADVWMWAAGPGPARPWHRRITMGESGEADSWAGSLDGEAQLAVGWLGVDLVDSPLAEGAIVAGVVGESPAADAGLAVGDRVVAADGERLPSARRIGELVARGGGPLELAVERRDATLTLTVDPRPVPSLAPRGAGDLPGPALWALLVCPDSPETRATPPWLAELQRSLLLLEAGQANDASRLLSGIQAPDSAGVGRGTVDYWLGVALLRAGRGGSEAAVALERAADSTARLSGEDGAPRVAPLARLFRRP